MTENRNDKPKRGWLARMLDTLGIVPDDDRNLADLDAPTCETPAAPRTANLDGDDLAAIVEALFGAGNHGDERPDDDDDTRTFDAHEADMLAHDLAEVFLQRRISATEWYDDPGWLGPRENYRRMARFVLGFALGMTGPAGEHTHERDCPACVDVFGEPGGWADQYPDDYAAPPENAPDHGHEHDDDPNGIPREKYDENGIAVVGQVPKRGPFTFPVKMGGKTIGWATEDGLTLADGVLAPPDKLAEIERTVFAKIGRTPAKWAHQLPEVADRDAGTYLLGDRMYQADGTPGEDDPDDPRLDANPPIGGTPEEHAEFVAWAAGVGRDMADRRGAPWFASKGTPEPDRGTVLVSVTGCHWEYGPLEAPMDDRLAGFMERDENGRMILTGWRMREGIGMIYRWGGDALDSFGPFRLDAGE